MTGSCLGKVTGEGMGSVSLEKNYVRECQKAGAISNIMAKSE
jgi:hypothetical protein